MRRVPYAGAVALLVALTACGSTPGTPSGGSPSNGPSSTPAGVPTASAGPNGDRAVAVMFERSGGKAGLDEVNRFAAGAPPPAGASRARVRAVLQAASTRALKSMHLPRMPQNLCCDRFVYTVRISYADGSSRIFRTADGLHQPPQLRALLSAAS